MCIFYVGLTSRAYILGDYKFARRIRLYLSDIYGLIKSSCIYNSEIITENQKLTKTTKNNFYTKGGCRN